MKALRRFSDLFLYSNCFIALCASAATYQTFLVAGKREVLFMAFVFCSTFVFYNLQRLFLLKRYSKEFCSGRRKWMLKNKKLQMTASVAALIISIPLMHSWSIKLILIFASFSVIATFYFIPQINLRAIPVVKAGYISLLWVFSTVVFPLLLLQEDSAGYNDFFVSLSFQRFFFILPLCIIFNVRDIKEDIAAAIKTLPVIYGIRVTKIICMILLGVFSVLVIIAGYDLQIKIGCLLSAVLTMSFILFVSEKSNEYFYSFWLDGMILLQAGTVMLSHAL